MLHSPERTYTVPLPADGEEKRAILDTYTKEHSAEYQAQALIDLAEFAQGQGLNPAEVLGFVQAAAAQQQQARRGCAAGTSCGAGRTGWR